MGRRGRKRAIVLPVLVAGAIAACTMSPSAETANEAMRQSPSATEKRDRLPGEYVVTVEDNGKEAGAAVRAAYSDFGVTRLAPIGNGRYLLTLERDPGVAEMQRRAQPIPLIKSVQPNFIYRNR